MSFFDDASLVMIPSGYKDQKVYSVKPIDGTGDLTFSRSNDTATRVNSSGLIEKVRTNVLTYSQDFSNAAWLKSNVSATSGQTDPNGGTSAFLVQTTTAESAYFYQPTTGAKCFSIYAKAGTKSNFAIINGLYNQGAGFNLSTQTVTNAGAGSLAKIQDVGGGWFRCSVYVSSSTEMIILLADVSGGGMSVGDNMSFAFAQAETGDIATDYIATTSAAVSVGPVANLPRLDYSGGATCPSLKLEPQRTNIQLNSEDFSQANWSKTNSAIVVNQLASPDGYLNADKLNETAVNNIHQLESSRSVTSGSTYTMSVFAKKGERDFVRLYEDSYANSAYFNLNTGVLGTVSGPTAAAKIEAIGSDGWYRCYLTYTETSNNFGRYRIAIAKQDNEVSYLGVAGSGIYVWGAQYEEGAYATSYIPTLSASVTRGADSAYRTSASAIIGQTEGTIYWEMQVDTPSATGHEDILNIDAGAFGNTIYFFKASNGNLTAEMYESSVGQASFTKTGITAGVYKCALGYANNNSAFFVNGLQVGTTDTSCSVPAMNRIQLGNGALGPSTGLTKQLLLFPTRLSNSDLATLTQI